MNKKQELWQFSESVLYELEKIAFIPDQVVLHNSGDEDGIDYLYRNYKSGEFMYINRLVSSDQYAFGFGKQHDGEIIRMDGDSALLKNVPEHAQMAAMQFVEYFNQANLTSSPS